MKDGTDEVKHEEESGTALRLSDLTALINPSPTRRLLIVLSFPLIFILAIPYWWYTTSIERLALPTARIAALETSKPPDIRTPIWFTADENAFPAPPAGRQTYDKDAVLRRLADDVTKNVDGLINQNSAATRSKRLWDLSTEKGRRSGHHLRIHIQASENANQSYLLQPYVQPPEHGLLSSRVEPGTLVIPVHPAKVGDVNLPLHYTMTTSSSLNALFPSYREPPDIPLRALKYAPNITLSFVVLNEDSTHGGYVHGWDIEEALKQHILPHLEPLKDVFSFNIESQVLYHAPLSFQPVLQQDEAVWRIDEDSMKVFVNSEQWSLDSGSTNNPVLRFLLFVPSASHRPLRLDTRESSESFLLPQYGAVVLADPHENTENTGYHLPSAALVSTFHLFRQHLFSLIDLPEIPTKIDLASTSSRHESGESVHQGLTPWQLEQVMRIRTRENSEEARKTLAGIVRLVAKIKEMKVGAGVRDKVLGAVERLERLDKAQNVKTAFVLSKEAVALANEAFFDPSMMGLLYFPDEHKFAVYTPLFAPVMVPMVIAVFKEISAWRARHKSQKT